MTRRHATDGRSLSRSTGIVTVERDSQRGAPTLDAVRIVASTTLLLLLAAGCSSDDPVAAPTSTTAAPEATTTTAPATTTTLGPAPTTPTSAAGGTVAGGTAPQAGPAPAAGCTVPAGYPEPWPERPRYSARLNVEPGKRLVTGDVAVRFVPTADTDRLVFRLWPNAPRIGRAGGRLEVTSASVGGQPVTGRYEAGGAVAGRPGTIWALPGRFAAAQPVDARLEFRLALPGAINDRVATAGRSVRLGSAIPVLSWIRGDGWQASPATHLNAEAAAGEVADWDVTVAAPAGYTTLATGQEEPLDPTSSFGGPSATRFVAQAVRDWAATVAPMRLGRASAQSGRTEVVVGVAEGAGGDPNAIAARNARALDELAARFGEYPYPRLTIGVTTGLTGGIEFPTHIFLGSGVAVVHLVHEVAHQWFYALAGNDQYRDPWLDESFATYGQSRVDGQLAYQRGRAIPAYGRGHLGESMAYWGRADGSTYYVSVYVGGTHALAKLGDRLGGYDPLDCAIRRYVKDRAYTVSRPSDFLAAVTAQTGVDAAPILAPFGIRS
jgi:hypothetical protein